MITKEQIQYLDRLRDRGVTNMLGAGPYLFEAFPEIESKKDANELLKEWIKIKEAEPTTTISLGDICDAIDAARKRSE